MNSFIRRLTAKNKRIIKTHEPACRSISRQVMAVNFQKVYLDNSFQKQKDSNLARMSNIWFFL